MSSSKLRFDGWVLDPESGDLERGGARIRLQEQPVQVLRELIAHAGSVVPREQLIALLWPKGVVDFDTGLNTVIRKLRSALGDTSDTPRYIETLPRRGYRFIGTLDAGPEAGSGASAALPVSPDSRASLGPAPALRQEPAVPPEAGLAAPGPMPGGHEPAARDDATSSTAMRVAPIRRPRLPAAALIGALAVVALLAGLYALWRARSGAAVTGVRVEAPSPSALPANVAPTRAVAPSWPPHAIAVLPFADLSEKHDQEYFADGMAEEIIDLLTKVPELRVTGRTSSFRFKGKGDDWRNIGTMLGAAYVVEGSVARFDKHVRITAQLIDTRDGTYRWSESYDRDISDVLSVQEEVALGIVRALQLEVASAVFGVPPAARPSAGAYEEYLRGLHARDRFDRRGFEEALAHFQHALQLEPSFSPAQEAAASTLYYMAESAFVPPESGFNQARAAAQAALKLDPGSAVAHAVICVVHTIFDWDWSAAARECAIATRLSPNQPFVLHAAAVQYMALGEWKDATASIEAAIANDPLDPALYNIAARIYDRAGRIQEAESAVRRALQISPTSAYNHHLLGIILLLQARPTEALAEMQREPDPRAQALGLALAYHALHRDRDADSAMARLVAEGGKDFASAIAGAYAFRAQKDPAFAWLDRAFVQRDEDLFAIKGAPLLKNLEGDPRYQAFLRKMNLPE